MLSDMSVSSVVFHAGDVLQKWMAAHPTVNSRTKLMAAAGVNKNTLTRIMDGQSHHSDTMERVVRALGRTQADLYATLLTPGAISEADRELLTAFHSLADADQETILDMVRLLRKRRRREDAP